MTTTKPRTTEALEDIRLRVEQSGKEPPQRALSLEIIRALKKMHPSIKLMQFTEVMTKRQVALSLPLTTIREDGSKKTGRNHAYLCAMQNAGYKLTHGKKTTLGSALLWLAEHPAFSSYKWATHRVEQAIQNKSWTQVPFVQLPV